MIGRTYVSFLATVLRCILLLFSTTALAFFLVEQSPVDYVQQFVGVGEAVSSSQREEIREQLGLNQSGMERYLQWLRGAIKMDFGYSLLYRTPVIEVISQRFWGSFRLMCTAWCLSGFIGLTVGVVMGTHHQKFLGRFLKSTCLIVASTPTFFVAIVMIMVFSVHLSLFPIGFSAPIGVLEEDVTLWQTLHHLLLPALTLSITSACSIALHTAETTKSVMESEYILFATSRNLPKNVIFFRHALKNILPPSLTLQFASVSELFGGSVLAETAFSYGGLGSCMVDAGLQGDSALLLGLTFFSALFVFVGNLTANLVGQQLDPRTKDTISTKGDPLS